MGQKIVAVGTVNNNFSQVIDAMSNVSLTRAGTKEFPKCKVCGGVVGITTYSWKYKDGSKFIYDMRCQKHLRKYDKPGVSDKQDRNAPCSCGSGKKFKKCCMGKEVKV